MKKPFSVTLTSYFILLNALVWLVFGVIVAADIHPALHVPPLVRGMMAVLSLAIAGFLLGLDFFLHRRSRIAYFLTLALLILIALLIFFDDFGWIDLLVLAVEVVPLILLLKDRTWYLQGKSAAVGGQ